MKAAICYSGYVRNYIPYFLNTKRKLIDNNKDCEFDIFISTWDTVNTDKNKNYFQVTQYHDYNLINIGQIKDIINPVCFNIESCKHDIIFNKFKKYTGQYNNTIAVFCQFYKIRTCAMLLEEYSKANNINYDVVIRKRFDFEIENFINLKKINVDLLNVDCNNTSSDGYSWVNDKICISNYNNFIKYSKFYENLEELIIKHNTNVPENLLGFYLKQQQIPIYKNDILNPTTWPPKY